MYFVSKSTFSVRPLPLPRPPVAPRHEHKHTPLDTHKFDLYTKSSATKWLESKQSATFCVVQMLDAIKDNLWYCHLQILVLEKKFWHRIFRFNDVIKQDWISKLFTEENKVPEHCLKLERRQGPPHINKVKQYLFCPLGGSLLSQSWKQREFI